jgi:hypothetical protein
MVQNESGSLKLVYNEALALPFCGREALFTHFSADSDLYGPSEDETAGAALERIKLAFSAFKDGVWDWNPAQR